MRHLLAAGLLPALLLLPLAAQDPETRDPDGQDPAAPIQLPAIPFETGTVSAAKGMARIDLGDGGPRYLQAPAARTLLENVWGNRPDPSVLGAVVPGGEEHPALSAWAIAISYEESGHVDDSDAANIDAGELMASMQESTTADNEERRKLGIGSVELLGWSQPPRYDSATKKLSWGKRLRFDDAPVVTINHDMRVLSREGVLVFTAICDEEDTQEVLAAADRVLTGTHLEPGHRYEDFDPSVDKVAAYGIGGLIAGKALLKTGLLKVLLKPLLFVAAIVGGILFKVFGGRKNATVETEPAA